MEVVTQELGLLASIMVIKLSTLRKGTTDGGGEPVLWPPPLLFIWPLLYIVKRLVLLSLVLMPPDPRKASCLPLILPLVAAAVPGQCSSLELRLCQVPCCGDDGHRICEVASVSLILPPARVGYGFFLIP